MEPIDRERIAEPQDGLAAVLGVAAGELVDVIPDRRELLWSRIEERRSQAAKVRRRVVSSAAAVLAVGLLGFGLATRSSPEAEVRSADRFERVERTVAPGLVLAVESTGSHLDLRLGPFRARASLTEEPLSPYEPFGVVPLGNGVAVTGATHGRSPDGLTSVVVVAVSVPQDAARARLVYDSSHIDVVDVRNHVEVLALSLDERDPNLEVTVEVYDRSGELLGAGSLLPFSQMPWTCETNTQMATVEEPPSTGSDSPESAPRRPFTAPLPAACD